MRKGVNTIIITSLTYGVIMYLLKTFFQEKTIVSKINNIRNPSLNVSKPQKIELYLTLSNTCISDSLITMSEYENKSHRKGKEKNLTKDKSKFMYSQKHARTTVSKCEKLTKPKYKDKRK